MRTQKVKRLWVSIFLQNDHIIVCFYNKPKKKWTQHSFEKIIFKNRIFTTIKFRRWKKLHNVLPDRIHLSVRRPRREEPNMRNFSISPMSICLPGDDYLKINNKVIAAKMLTVLSVRNPISILEPLMQPEFMVMLCYLFLSFGCLFMMQTLSF